MGSRSVYFFTFSVARDKAEALDWVLQGSGTMIFTIVQKSGFLLQDERNGWNHRLFFLYSGPPSTGVPMLDLLLLEVVQDPTRNHQYRPDAEKCALIAQSLWLSVLPS